MYTGMLGECALSHARNLYSYFVDHDDYILTPTSRHKSQPLHHFNIETDFLRRLHTPARITRSELSTMYHLRRIHHKICCNVVCVCVWISYFQVLAQIILTWHEEFQEHLLYNVMYNFWWMAGKCIVNSNRINLSKSWLLSWAKRIFWHQF